MGTSSLICIWYKGRFVVAQYSQFDGYLEGQGSRILKFLIKPENIERLKAGLEHIKVVSEEEVDEIREKVEQDGMARELAGDPTASPFMFSFNGSEFDKLFPSLSQLTGAKILEVISQSTPESPLPIYMELDFANNSLFCEWAYCVDLDTRTFEIFRGGCPKHLSVSKRFQDVGKENAAVPALVKSYSLDKLPQSQKEFVRSVKKAIKSGYSAEDASFDDEANENQD